MRIEHLREFLELAKCRSFSEAARRLFISTSALSRHISDMEEELGQPLVLRANNGASLTKAGEIAFEECARVVADYDRMAERLERSRMGAEGRLRIAFPYLSAYKYLEPFLAKFEKKHPWVLVEAVPATSSEVGVSVAGKKADIGIDIRYMLVDDIDDHLTFVAMGKEPFSVCVSRDDALATRGSVNLTDLNGRLVVLASEFKSYSRFVEHLLSVSGVIPERFLYAESAPMVDRIVRHRHAVALRNEFLSREPSPDVVYVPLEDCAACADVGLLYRNDNDNPCISLFVEAVLD